MKLYLAVAFCFREYIFDLLEGGHKMIVFAHHMQMLDAICTALLKKVHVYFFIMNISSTGSSLLCLNPANVMFLSH